MADQFTFASIKTLDNLIQEHATKFLQVEEYSGCEKPKLWLRNTYPVDIFHMGPLIRSWCMTFEAILQVLKHIAAHSNYKNVEARMARVWAIRQGLMLKEAKLSKWNEMKTTYARHAFTVSCTSQENDMRSNVPLDSIYQMVRAFSGCNAHVLCLVTCTQPARVTRALPTCYARLLACYARQYVRCVHVTCIRTRA